MLSTKANAICIWWHYSNSNGSNNNIATRRTTNDRLISIKHFSGAGQKPKRTHTRVEREGGRGTRVAKGMRGLGIGIRTLAIQGRLAWLSALVLLGVHDVALAAHRLNQNQPGQAPDAGKGMPGQPWLVCCKEGVRGVGEGGVFRKVRSNVRGAAGWQAGWEFLHLTPLVF